MGDQRWAAEVLGVFAVCLCRVDAWEPDGIPLQARARICENQLLLLSKRLLSLLVGNKAVMISRISFGSKGVVEEE